MKLIRTTLESPAAQLYFMGCCSWLLLLAMGSGCTQQEPTSGVPQELASKAQPALVRLPALPARQEVRVNDTLVLVCSQPYTTLPQYLKPSLVLWSHLALRGRRGYEEVLSEADPLLLYCLYQCHDEALVSAQGSVLHFSVLDVGRIPWTEARRGQPLPDRAVYALDSWIWDVRYRVPASYMSADLKELNLRDAPCFTGGMAGDSIPEEYRVLPYWINQELAQLKRRHRLPPARRLLAYSTFSRDLATTQDSAYRQGYGHLLLRLLRAWRAYPLPAATARHLDRSIQDLRVALRKAPFPAR
ncbi:MAG: hypothetical protein EOO60_04735 [Hymenobacter sp.]|nr:MAG: hypothetical protein EOO60_04735 [Hymenobacter sp.]